MSTQAFPILVVEDNADHQILIGRALSLSFPQARLVFSDTAQQALAYLQSSLTQQAPLIRLVLLDIYLPRAESGWQLLTTIRTDYPLLPVVAFSAQQTPDDVKRAYQLRVHSFLAKPLIVDEWSRYFETLRIYWMETVTLPPARYF